MDPQETIKQMLESVRYVRIRAESSSYSNSTFTFSLMDALNSSNILMFAQIYLNVREEWMSILSLLSSEVISANNPLLNQLTVFLGRNEFGSICPKQNTDIIEIKSSANPQHVMEMNINKVNRRHPLCEVTDHNKEAICEIKPFATCTNIVDVHFKKASLCLDIKKLLLVLSINLSLRLYNLHTFMIPKVVMSFIVRRPPELQLPDPPMRLWLDDDQVLSQCIANSFYIRSAGYTDSDGFIYYNMIDLMTQVVVCTAEVNTEGCVNVYNAVGQCAFKTTSVLETDEYVEIYSKTNTLLGFFLNGRIYQKTETGRQDYSMYVVPRVIPVFDRVPNAPNRIYDIYDNRFTPLMSIFNRYDCVMVNIFGALCTDLAKAGAITYGLIAAYQHYGIHAMPMPHISLYFAQEDSMTMQLQAL